MIFIKNNKVFLFLCLSFIVINLLLSYRILYGNKNSNGNSVEAPTYTNNSISYFNADFSDQRMGVEFSWNVQVGNSSIEKYEIIQGGKVLKSGKNAASAVLAMKDFDFPTGNNKFDLLVTFKSEETLNKTVYVYIDEAFNFNVIQSMEGNKIIYTLSYYYDDRRIATPPQMSVKNSSQPFNVQYIEANEVKKEGPYVQMEAKYELGFANVEPGKYSVEIIWEYSNYNLVFNSTSEIEVGG